MKVLLVNPPNNKTITSNVPQFLQEKTAYLPPLGLLYIASFVEQQKDCSVKIYDAVIYNTDYTTVARVAKDYDVIGITTTTFTLIDAIETVKAIRRDNASAIIVLGGPHLAIFPQESIAIPGVDFVLQGEGEKSFAQLVELLAENSKEYSTVPGLYWKEEDQIKWNPKDSFIVNLDELPIPNRQLLDYTFYHSLLSKQKVEDHYVTTAFSSRGCPYKCIFCDRPNMGKAFRSHSPQYVLDDISKALELGIREVIFYDDTFTIERERVNEICELILQRAIKIEWDVRARVNDVNRDMLALMKRAGCTRIHFGVESGNPDMMRILKKGITRERALQVFQDAHEVGIETLGYFMFGCPNETRSQMQETFDFALELNPDYAHFAILTPFPGTPLYSEAVQEGLYESDYWQEFAQSPDPDFLPPTLPNTLTREELVLVLKKAYKKFYVRPKYIIKELLQVSSWNDFAKKTNLALNMMWH
jgi:radical SAM superfamily enzyme YgiQ (UPF0313 family)